jgi:SAM-dependent methyltransferase
LSYDAARYWEDTLGAHYSTRGVGYPELPEAFNRFIYRALASSAARLLDDHRVSAGEVIDVGFGTGEWLEFWRERGAARVDGIDLTETAVERGRRRYPDLELFRGDVSDEALPTDRRYDAVSAMNVLLHVTDDDRCRRALANLRALLRPGGHLLAAEPVVVHAFSPRPGPADATSVARPLAWWRSALAEAGLAPIAIRPATCLLGNPVDAPNELLYRALLRSWFGVGRLVGESEVRARAVGAPLYLADRMLSSALRYGVSGKLLLAKAV